MRVNQIRTLEINQAEAMACACFRFGIIALASLILMTVANSLSMAQGFGGVTVTPTRIVFEGRQKSAEVTLVNTASTPSTYRISFKNMQMLEDGSYQDITEPVNGEFFADELIRYSPRQVNLAGGESQTIRLQLRKPADLATGEYRSHLLLQSLPPETEGADIEKADLKEGEIAVKILTTYAVTIPVIVRHGELSASATISDLALNPSQDTTNSAVFFLRLNRSGDRSISGELNVTFKSDQSGDEQVVGLAGNINVLSPYPARTVNISLKAPDGLPLQKGLLHVVYRARPEDGGAVLADAELRIP
jgi:P pilus assembly chaperone PapD